MDKHNMRFLFGDRELLLTAGHLLSAAVEVVVNMTDEMLRHQDGLGLQICQQGGDRIRQESEQLIREYGHIDKGMAVYTTGGELPYKAIIHAVVPGLTDEDPGRLLEQALSRSLQLCDMNEWRSVGFPLIGLELAGLGIDEAARAYFRAITHFWDARHDCAVEKVTLCLHAGQFRAFFDAFREQGLADEMPPGSQSGPASAEQAGEIDLSEADIADLDDSDIDSWFK